MDKSEDRARTEFPVQPRVPSAFVAEEVRLPLDAKTDLGQLRHLGELAGMKGPEMDPAPKAYEYGPFRAPRRRGIESRRCHRAAALVWNALGAEPRLGDSFVFRHVGHAAVEAVPRASSALAAAELGARAPNTQSLSRKVPAQVQRPADPEPRRVQPGANPRRPGERLRSDGVWLARPRGGSLLRAAAAQGAARPELPVQRQGGDAVAHPGKGPLPVPAEERGSHLDDYYLNVLDWSAEDNLAVGLGSSVDLWNAFSGRASRLCELDRPVASIRWSHEAGRFDRVALGLADGEVQIWDASVGQKVQSLQGHLRRTCALAWADSSLFSGSQDTHIFRWDMRTPSPVQNLQGHTEEVCGLAWSKELRVLASGGNEGAVNLWTDQGELRRLGCHQAACRALAWSPKGVLATGGGTADRTIRLWTASGTQTSCVQTEAQVCSLAWSPSGDGELISTHGFSTYEVNLWKTTGGLSRLHCLQWHKARVLFLAMSPEGALVFGTGNEMLCFWHLFAKHRVSTASSSMSSEVSGLSRTIR
ncbi:unnamed protein product [Effrenium voratum]|nr:unnamed protein product [Effrenium voratum]